MSSPSSSAGKAAIAAEVFKAVPEWSKNVIIFIVFAAIAVGIYYAYVFFSNIGDLLGVTCSDEEKAMQIPTGDPCSLEKNCTCESGQCGRVGISSDYQCCESISIGRGPKVKDLCDNVVPPGDACYIDDQCQAPEGRKAFCDNDFETQEGVCFVLGKDGDVCTNSTVDNDHYCEEGLVCALAEYGSSMNTHIYKCRPDAQTANCGGREVISDMPDGQTCMCNQNCATKLCRGNGSSLYSVPDEGVQEGKCGKGRKDEKCWNGANDCVSGVCVGPAAEAGTCGPYEDGRSCYEDGDCSGGYCKGGTFASAGKCRTPAQMWQPCDATGDDGLCVSGASCAQMAYGTNIWLCYPNEDVVDCLAGESYSNNPVGATCRCNGECATNSCSNPNALVEGKCQAQRSIPTWGPCNSSGDDDQCQSSDAKCAQKYWGSNEWYCYPREDTTECNAGDSYKNNPLNQPCRCNQECASFYCYGNGGPGMAGTSEINWTGRWGTCAS